MTLTPVRAHTGGLGGALLACLIACAAFCLGELPPLKELSISPMVLGIALGMAYANTLSGAMPADWALGIAFCSKRILRLGIILYGFRLTLGDVLGVGLPTLAIDATVVTVTILLGVGLGRLLNMDRGTALLTAVGSAVCGAAAVLGAESATRAKPYQTAVAVATVVLFGTLSMFLYPALYRLCILGLSEQAMGIYTGSTLHEVAHVVGAGHAMGGGIAGNAIIVKMIRVTMLVPVLIILSVIADRAGRQGPQPLAGEAPRRLRLPWFALLFLLAICLNSLWQPPVAVGAAINLCDSFLLTVAMAALGMETSFSSFRKAGAKPFLLAALLYLWLVLGGYGMARAADAFLL
ncbi:MAG: YeiH family protein [Succinivibrionaceae bacterium]|nr:YeiH family protein [Succinivibrionaceae bacterium]